MKNAHKSVLALGLLAFTAGIAAPAMAQTIGATHFDKNVQEIDFAMPADYDWNDDFDMEPYDFATDKAETIKYLNEEVSTLKDKAATADITKAIKALASQNDEDKFYEAIDAVYTALDAYYENHTDEGYNFDEDFGGEDFEYNFDEMKADMLEYLQEEVKEETDATKKALIQKTLTNLKSITDEAKFEQAVSDLFEKLYAPTQAELKEWLEETKLEAEHIEESDIRVEVQKLMVKAEKALAAKDTETFENTMFEIDELIPYNFANDKAAMIKELQSELKETKDADEKKELTELLTQLNGATTEDEFFSALMGGEGHTECGFDDEDYDYDDEDDGWFDGGWFDWDDEDHDEHSESTKRK